MQISAVKPKLINRVFDIVGTDAGDDRKIDGDIDGVEGEGTNKVARGDNGEADGGGNGVADGIMDGASHMLPDEPRNMSSFKLTCEISQTKQKPNEDAP
mmetsp:Transcript_30593/g.70029  ORF Transcript_30593/g.70029 Transcript_30593/m.70029 type:complete len:99 (-) Transcript_30593:700-996(-)